jgi:hypothetical protein
MGFIKAIFDLFYMSIRYLNRHSGHVYRWLVIILLSSSTAILADVTPDLTYEEPADGLSVMQQVYFVNRHFAFENLMIGTKSSPVRMLTRQGERLSTGNTLIRSLNNAPTKSGVLFQDKVHFPTGKIRGTAILVTGYRDRSASYSLWLPQLRKVRRISEPAHDDRWGGSPLTYGDVYFRKPGHETHELLGSETFDDCLGMFVLTADIPRHKLTGLPEKSCTKRGKNVYRVKSTTKYNNWWYDYRVVSVDKQTFADYRADYFKGDKLVKRIDKDWQVIDESDPRAVMWRYWYAHDYLNGQEAVGYVDLDAVSWNQQVKASQWTERALRKIKR